MPIYYKYLVVHYNQADLLTDEQMLKREKEQEELFKDRTTDVLMSVSDLYTCGKCKKNKTSYISKQVTTDILRL